jgi:hypothetical protein
LLDAKDYMCRDFKKLTLETCEPSRNYIARKSYVACRTLVDVPVDNCISHGDPHLGPGSPLLLEAQIQVLGAQKLILGAK